MQDDGPGFRGELPSVDDLPPVEQVAGRGLFLVLSLVDSLTVSAAPGGTVVRCVKRHLFVEPSEPG